MNGILIRMDPSLQRILLLDQGRKFGGNVKRERTMNGKHLYPVGFEEMDALYVGALRLSNLTH